MVERTINKDIVDSINKFIEEIKKQYNVTAIILFGSYAKQMANHVSDLDFIIDTKGVLLGFDFFSLIDDIEKEFNKKVDAFEKLEIIANSKIDNEIKQTGVIVYER